MDTIRFIRHEIERLRSLQGESEKDRKLLKRAENTPVELFNENRDANNTQNRIVMSNLEDIVTYLGLQDPYRLIHFKEFKKRIEGPPYKTNSEFVRGVIGLAALSRDYKLGNDGRRRRYIWGRGR